MAIVLYDIHQINQEFEIPGFVDRIKKWFKDFREVFKKSATATFGPVELKMSGQMHATASFNLSYEDVEKDLRLLEKELKSLKKRTNKGFQEINLNLKKLENEIENEKQIREQELKSFKGFFKRITTSGFLCEIVGLIWLVFGLIFSIFSKEICFILK